MNNKNITNQMPITDPITAYSKLISGTQYLKNSEIKLVFAPDAVRDNEIMIDNVDQFIDDALKENSKNRMGMNATIKIGGHGAIGIISAATLRQDMNVECALVAKVFAGAKKEVLDYFINGSIAAKGATPINTDYVLDDNGAAGKTNIVLETKRHTKTGIAQHTTIGTVRGQPTLKLANFDDRTFELLKKLDEADVVGVLSLKSHMMKELPQAMRDAKLGFKELVSDATTGDDTQVVVDAINFLKKDGRAITLLSLNDEEAVRYAQIAWILKNDPTGIDALKSNEYCEAKKQFDDAQNKLSDLEKAGALPSAKVGLNEKIRECETTIKKCSDEFEMGLVPKHSKEWKANPLKAAKFLNEDLGIPLLFHNFAGSKIFDKTGKKETAFVPSISLVPASGTLGAGDTMLGAIMLAMAVKARLEKENAPAHLKMSLEDCLMVANVATGFRLQNEKVAGTANECYEWVRQTTTNLTALKSAGKKGHWQAGVANEVKHVEERFKALQEAKKSGFAALDCDKANAQVGDFVVERFRVEEIRSGFTKPNDAASKKVISDLLGYVNGKDPVFSGAAIDSLRILAKSNPSVKDMIRDELGIGKTRVAAMFDLDATLFDSKAARERAGARGIMAMLLKTNDGKTLSFESSQRLFIALYNRHEEFKAMGFPDFRQVWNCPQMYAAAAAIVRAGGKGGSPIENSNELASTLALIEKQSTNPLLDINSNYSQILATKINNIMNYGNYLMRINNAEKAYVETGLVPYLDARRTLSILRDLLGADCYIVTEGHDPTQRDKVRMLGLSEFFGEGDRVLSTGYAKAPWRVAAGLSVEQERLRKAKLDSTDEYAKTLEKTVEAIKNGADVVEIATTMKRVEGAKCAIATYSEEKAVFDWVSSMFTRNAKKSGEAGAFYSEVLRAINKSHDNPREAIGAGDHANGKAAPFIAFMAGDRLDNDIVAMELVSKEVVPIIVKKGNYAIEYGEAVKSIETLQIAKKTNTTPKEEIVKEKEKLNKLLGLSGERTLEEYEALMPKLEANTLSDVARFILSKSTYSGVVHVSQPKKMQVDFGENVLDNALLGKLSPSNTIKMFCEDVLKSIAHGPEDKICQAVEYFTQHLKNEHLENSHQNHRPSQMKVAAAENLAILLENCPNHTQKIAKAATDAASELVKGFMDKAEDPKTREEFVNAYGRISDDNSPITNLLGESAEFPDFLIHALDITCAKIQRTNRLKEAVAAVVNAVENTGRICTKMQSAAIASGDYLMYKQAVKQIIKDMNLRDYKDHPQLSGICAQAASMYTACMDAKYRKEMNADRRERINISREQKKMIG